MAKIKGTLRGDFTFDEDTGEMYTLCNVDCENQPEGLSFDVVMRAYIALGGYLNKINLKLRYDIDTLEESENLVKEMIKKEK